MRGKFLLLLNDFSRDCSYYIKKEDFFGGLPLDFLLANTKSEILADSSRIQSSCGTDKLWGGKIMSLVQNGPRGICSSGGINIYEGPFQILSLTGSYTVAETGMGRCNMGGLSVSLAGADGRVIGGGVAGPLIAASRVQTVVGSFIPNAYRNHRGMQQEANPRHQYSRG